MIFFFKTATVQYVHLLSSNSIEPNKSALKDNLKTGVNIMSSVPPAVLFCPTNSAF